MAGQRKSRGPLGCKPFENVEVARAIFLSEKEQQAFVRACSAEPDFQRLVRAGLYAGCRYGELSRLRFSDFNSSAMTLFVGQTKSGKQRHVHLDPEAGEFFRGMCANRESGETMLTKKNGEPWVKDAQRKPQRRACARAKIESLDSTNCGTAQRADGLLWVFP